jgi:ABC-type lipoprotein export system ATPase subunit
LEQVSIADQAHKLPSALSGGQQQRAAIARALANDPLLIVGDEPTGNLDTVTANEMFALFERLVEQGKTLMIVTHDRELSAQTERVLHLLDGRLHRDENNGKQGVPYLDSASITPPASTSVERRIQVPAAIPALLPDPV